MIIETEIIKKESTMHNLITFSFQGKCKWSQLTEEIISTLKRSPAMGKKIFFKPNSLRSTEKNQCQGGFVARSYKLILWSWHNANTKVKEHKTTRKDNQGLNLLINTYFKKPKWNSKLNQCTRSNARMVRCKDIR